MKNSELRKNIMNAYSIYDHDSYEMVKLECDNLKIKRKNDNKIIDLRY